MNSELEREVVRLRAEVKKAQLDLEAVECADTRALAHRLLRLQEATVEARARSTQLEAECSRLRAELAAGDRG